MSATALEIVRQVVRGEWRTPIGEPLPAVTESDIVAAQIAEGVVNALQRCGLLKAAWCKAKSRDGRWVVISLDPYMAAGLGVPALITVDGAPWGIHAVSRARDGGTTQIHCRQGVIIVPTPFAEDQRPIVRDA